MNFSHDGISLWYGTPDAPAPYDLEIVPRQGVSVVVGVHPANPTNAVLVRFRVDGGMEQAVPGRELRTDFARGVQYFAATFPAMPSGSVVEFAPSVSSAGRQAPAPQLAGRFPSRFRLAEAQPRVIPRPARTAPSASTSTHASPRANGALVDPGLGYVATVSVAFEPFQFVGEVATGMRVNFFVREGSVEGPGVHGRVTAGSCDQMLIRHDGMGVVRIRAAFETDDGAVLDVEAGGYVDFGPDGYRDAVARRLPDRSPLLVSPLLSTRHAKYAWLSRIQCVGSGYTHLDAGQAYYCVYAVQPKIPRA